MTGPHSKPVARWLGDASDLPQLWIASLQIGGASHRQANLFPRFPVLFLRVRIVELVFFSLLPFETAASRWHSRGGRRRYRRQAGGKRCSRSLLAWRVLSMWSCVVHWPEEEARRFRVSPPAATPELCAVTSLLRPASTCSSRRLHAIVTLPATREWSSAEIIGPAIPCLLKTYLSAKITSHTLPLFKHPGLYNHRVWLKYMKVILFFFLNLDICI